MKLAVLTTAVLVGASALRAQEPGAAFLSVNPSVRSESMGGSHGFLTGIETLNINPSFLESTQVPWQVYTSVSQLDEETQFVHLALGHTRGTVPWGISVTHLRAEGESSRDNSGLSGGAGTDAQDTALAAGFSHQWPKGFRWGITGRAFTSSLGNYRADPTWAMDGGMGWRKETVSVGLTVRNIGPGQKFIKQTDPLPQVLEGVSAVRLKNLTLEGGIQNDVVRGGTGWLLGMEYQMGLMAMRSGYSVDAASKKDKTLSAFDRVTFGFGLALPSRLTLDYAFQQATENGRSIHRIALAWAWGETPPTPNPKVKVKAKKSIKKKSPPKTNKPAPKKQKRLRLKK